MSFNAGAAHRACADAWRRVHLNDQGDTAELTLVVTDKCRQERKENKP